MKITLMSVLLLLLCAAVAGAQTNWPYNNNNIGMYFDEAGTNYCCGSPPGNFVSVYLVLTQATSTTIGGWEAKITFQGAGAVPTSFVPRYPNVDAATRLDEFIVGYGSPQPTVNSNLVLMDITLYVVDGMIPTYGYVGPIYYHSVPESLPAYLDGADLNLVVPMYPHLGGIDDWVISLNNGCVVENETASFGSVKSLFR